MGVSAEETRYIRGENNGDIRQPAGRDGKELPDFDAALIEAELDHIAEKKGAEVPHVTALLKLLRGGAPGAEPPYLFGMALSGGGIRSATFSLGVLQRLARSRLLEHVDYLSTVSGGGYIGSALSWWLSGGTGCPASRRRDLGNDFPYGINDPRKARHHDKPILRYLRQSGEYLTPGAGITLWSGIAVVGRAVLLNLLVWVPVVAFVFYLINQAGRLPFLSGLHVMIGMVAPSAVPTLGQLTGTDGSLDSQQLIPPVFLLCLLLVVLIAGLFIISSINFSVLAWMERGEAARRDKQRQTVGGPLTSVVDRDFVESRDSWTPLIRNVGRWLLVGILGLIDVATIFILFRWLIGPIEMMFRPDATPATVSGTLFNQWPLALVITAVIALLIWSVARRDRWSWPDARGFFIIFLIFAGCFALDGLFLWWISVERASPHYGPISLPWISALLQLIVVVGLFVLVNFWVAYLIRWLLRTENLSVTYGGRRLFEIVFGLATVVSLSLLAVGTVPLVDAWIGQKIVGLEGAISVGGGVASAIWGHVRARSGKGSGRFTTLILIGGSVLFLYGIALLGYRLAVIFDNGNSTAQAVLAALLLIGVITGWFTNINYISLHRFYRDRLMEAFMPDYETVESGVPHAAGRADDFPIADLWEKGPPYGPFHIINTNLVLANSLVRKYRSRGGDNFMLSSLYSGSAATGWQTSTTLVNGEITLASAMAASGAAANPRGGPGGRGLTRNHFVALLMTLLSFRLGFWIPRPSPSKKYVKHPNHFLPSGLYSIFNLGYRETNRVIELSDGGHFENLAIYELVRRRCGLIIVCDGGQDNESSYADFVTAIQRIGQDFGATVDFDMQVADAAFGGFKSSGPEALIARAQTSKYPKDAEYAEKGFFLATIDYGRRGGGAWPQKGTVIYLKSAMIDALSMSAKGYKGANPDFPNETTVDQFFDEEQFEAYRELGYRIAEQMLEYLDLEKLFANGRPNYGALRRNDEFRSRG